MNLTQYFRKKIKFLGTNTLSLVNVYMKEVFVERVTNNFIKNNKIINKKRINDYYLLSEMFRKELLSDILEYESILTETIITNFKFDDILIKDLYINDYDFIEKNNKEKFIKLLFYKKNLSINKNISFAFNSLPFGSKLKIIRVLNKEILFNILKEYFVNYDLFLPHLKYDKKLIHSYLIPILEYMKALRNFISHNRFSIDFKSNFLNSYILTNRIYRMSKMIKMVDYQLNKVHKNKFMKRFKQKLRKNKKISKKIWKDII